MRAASLAFWPSMERYFFPADLIQAACFFGYGIGEEGFVGADRGEIDHHAFDEGGELFMLFGRHNEHLASETMAEGVVLYAFFGFWSGRSLLGFEVFEGGGLVLEIGDEGRHFEDRLADVLE
jgi:hypothetical protein